MKRIKLSGREMAVLRAIDNLGNTGEEIRERTQIEMLDLADILHALCDVGYVEAYVGGGHLPAVDPVKAPEVPAARFEINPSYAQELKKAIAHR